MTPDIFTHVHMGLRRALFEACSALGRARDEAAARDLLREALHFVHHHGLNEDDLLLPMLVERAPAVHARMQAAHAELDPILAALVARTADAPLPALYRDACRFTALYLAHMDEEEGVLEPQIRAVVPAEVLAGFGRAAVQRTAPADQRMMLGWMVPALPAADAEAILGRLPAALADALRAQSA